MSALLRTAEAIKVADLNQNSSPYQWLLFCKNANSVNPIFLILSFLTKSASKEI